MTEPSHNSATGDVSGLGVQLEKLSASHGEALDVSRDESLARHSSMRVGGPAAIWAEVGAPDALAALLSAADRADVPVFPVGLGSNVLFPDEGIAGVVLRLVGEFDGWRVIDELEDSAQPRETAKVEVGAGTVNAHLVRGLLDDGWTGLEFLNLVPGTFGGAVALNAGTKEAELCERLVEVEWCRRTSGSLEAGFETEWVDVETLSMDYRYAEVPKDAVITRGVVSVASGDVDEARERMQADRARRDETQPYKLASWGSTFANPPGDYAGRLIDEAGLKGRRVGGAKISDHHANFFINEDDATTDDLLALMALARVRVREMFDVDLRPEVRFVGFDGAERLAAFEAEWSQTETGANTEVDAGGTRGLSATGC